MTRRRNQVLFLDADDTLWENNIYFERALEAFYDLLPGCERTRARACINQHERRVIAAQGYGLASFRVALGAAWRELAPQSWDARAEAAIAELAHVIAAEPIQFLPGAIETLAYLAPRHRLFLLTKGDFAEQSGKVRRAGVARWFEQVYVVPEKSEATYRQRLLSPASACWMIGNSPKSDINPALAAGMNAVFIPHPHTWILEREPLLAPPSPSCQFLQLACLADLTSAF